MRVGIHLDYRRCTVTYTALRVARILAERGYDVCLRAKENIRCQLDPVFDSLVEYPTAASSSFNSWASSCNILFWPELPQVGDLLACRGLSSSTVKIVGFSAHRMRLSYGIESIRFADKIACYTQTVRGVLGSHHYFRNLHHVPVIPTYPMLRRSALSSDGPRIAILIGADRPGPVSEDTTELLKLPNVSAFYVRRWMPGSRFDCLPAGRSHRLDRLNHTQVRGLLANHDLAVCTDMACSTGYWSLESLSAGVPVVACAQTAAVEHVTHMEDSYLVGTKEYKDSLGLPHPRHDPGAMVKTVNRVLTSGVLPHLLARVGSRLEETRKRSVDAWLRLFDYDC